MKTFKELGLSAEIMKSLDDLGFVEPTPVQGEAIPFVLKSEQDLVALAQTGTGKTAAFGLPILQKISPDGRTPQAIILAPTRELAIQISQDIRDLAKHSKGVTVMPVYGGERIDLQIRTLKRGVNIVVGTPGRVHDLIRRRVLKLGTIKWVVLDEADEMLDMGFKEDLDAILGETPEERQTLLFSATMSKSVSNIAKKYMKDAHEISLGSKNIGAENVTHEYYVVNSRDRFEALKRILDCLPGVYGILFCRTRRETQDIADKLRQANYEVEAIHGEVSQAIRTKIMGRFKKKQIRLLVATDVAARGIDVKNLTHVINYNLPDNNEAYTHRSGRTGRANQSGISVAIVGASEVRRVREIERIIGKAFEKKQVPEGKDVYEKLVDNFVDTIKHSDIEESTDEKYVSEIIGKLKSITKENLIRHFVAKELTPLFEDHKNTRDLNASFREPGKAREPRERKEMTNSVNLQIDLGRKQRFDIKALFSLINSSSKLRGIEVGEINLMPEATIFAVEPRMADVAIKALSGIDVKGRKVKITKADDSVSYPKSNYKRSRSTSSSSGGGYGKRKGGRSPRGSYGEKVSGGYGERSRGGGSGASRSRKRSNNASSGKPRRSSPFGNKKRNK